MAKHEEAGDVVCSLCLREVPRELITQHHLTPREKGGKAEDRVPMCKVCHRQLHAVFGNTELARVYPTIEALRSSSELRGFLVWIRKQKVDRTFQVRRSRSHPRWGRG